MRSPTGPPKNSTPPPGKTETCVEFPPKAERVPVKQEGDPGAELLLQLLEKSMNPTLPTTNGRTLCVAAKVNFGPNRPVSGRTLAVTDVAAKPLEFVVTKVCSKL